MCENIHFQSMKQNAETRVWILALLLFRSLPRHGPEKIQTAKQKGWADPTTTLVFGRTAKPPRAISVQPVLALFHRTGTKTGKIKTNGQRKGKSDVRHAPCFPRMVLVSISSRSLLTILIPAQRNDRVCACLILFFLICLPARLPCQVSRAGLPASFCGYVAGFERWLARTKVLFDATRARSPLFAGTQNASQCGRFSVIGWPAFDLRGEGTYCEVHAPTCFHQSTLCRDWACASCACCWALSLHSASA